MIDAVIGQRLEAIAHGQRVRDLESQVLEFKSVGRSLDDTLTNLAEACACFANADGGTVVVGVADDVAGSGAFVGSPLDPVRTQHRIFELTTPGLIVVVQSVVHLDVDLTIITVPRSPTLHQVRGRASERMGASCMPMTPQRIAAVMLERSGHDWSADDSDRSVDDVDDVAVGLVRRRLREVSDAERQTWATKPVRDLLRRLGLMGTGTRLNNAGALLVTDHGRTHFRYVHRITMSGELTANQDVAGTGLEALLEVSDLIMRRVDRSPVNLPLGQQLFIADLPDSAVREAVANAFMHRDHYRRAGVFVEHSPERLRITSPGGFLIGVTPNNVLTTPARARNPVLANAIRALGLAEAAGVGVERMYVAMTEVGHRPPTITADGEQVSISLNGGRPDADVVRFLATLPDIQRRDLNVLLVLTTLRVDRTTTAAKMAPVLQRSDAEAEALLGHLADGDDPLIERTRNSERLRRSTYRLREPVVEALGSAVAYRTHSADAAGLIVGYVREFDAITSKVVQSMFDVQPATASRYLADLVDQGVLVRTSTATRGPSVAYGKGPTFPRAMKRAPAKQPSTLPTTKPTAPTRTTMKNRMKQTMKHDDAGDRSRD